MELSGKKPVFRLTKRIHKDSQTVQRKVAKSFGSNQDQMLMEVS